MTHASKRGTDKFRGLLKTERNEDPLYLWMLREVVLEPADDLHLLRLLEGLPAIVHGNTNELLGLREVEVQPLVEPFLLHLFITLLPVFTWDELRYNVRDEVDLMVLAEAGLLRRVVHLLLLLLRHELV